MSLFGEDISAFFATVDKVFQSKEDFDKYTDDSKKATSVYNGNKNFSDKDSFKYGSITYYYEDSIENEDFAQPFDKNNITFPIEGETVTIIEIDDVYYWLPYSNTQYPNYREDIGVSEKTKEKVIESSNTSNNNKNYNDAKSGIPNVETVKTTSDSKSYKVNEKIKFLNPNESEKAIITGYSFLSLIFNSKMK
mgnify:CR=1 FL=1